MLPVLCVRDWSGWLVPALALEFLHPWSCTSWPVVAPRGQMPGAVHPQASKAKSALGGPRAGLPLQYVNPGTQGPALPVGHTGVGKEDQGVCRWRCSVRLPVNMDLLRRERFPVSQDSAFFPACAKCREELRCLKPGSLASETPAEVGK